MNRFIFMALLGAALCSHVFAGDSYEPDDTPEQARVLTGNAVITDHVADDSDDIDWFTFTITEERVLHMAARVGFDLMDINLYDDEINFLQFGGEVTRDLTPGTYFFSVEPFFKDTKGFFSDYTLYFSLSRYNEDRSEPNNSAEEATPLTEGEFLQVQSIAPAGDADWFTFEADFPKQPVALRYIVEAQPPLRFVRISVFTPFDTPAFLNSPQQEGNRAWVTLTPGTHTVRVEEFVTNDRIVPIYNIVVWNTMNPDPYEDDNSPAEATLLMVDGPRQTHNFTDGDDEDWYIIFANFQDDMFFGADEHVRLELFEADAETVYDVEFADGNIDTRLEPGTYYLRATPRDSNPSPEGSVYSISAVLNNAGLNVVGTLTGTVQTPNKMLPLGGVEVALTGAFATTTRTDSDGIYVFPMLTQGTYTVNVAPEGYIGSSTNRNVGGGVSTANFLLQAEVVIEPEDLNGDGNINAVDIQLIINEILGIGTMSVDGDVNGDGNTNASDIQAIINRVLGG